MLKIRFRFIREHSGDCHILKLLKILKCNSASWIALMVTFNVLVMEKGMQVLECRYYPIFLQSRDAYFYFNGTY